MAGSAVSPYQASSGAITVRDASLKLFEIASLSSEVESKKQEARQNMLQKKEIFDELWKKHYSDIAEYWTFENTIQSFKVLRLIFCLQIKSSHCVRCLTRAETSSKID